MEMVPARTLFLSGFLLASVLLPVAPVLADQPAANPHAHFQQPAQCPRCHLYKGPNPDPGRISTASIEFCLECHLAEGQDRTHPLKVSPDSSMRGMKVPPGYPLGDGAYVICLTCHTAHGPFLSDVRAFPGQQPTMPDRAERAPSYRSYFMRRSTPGENAFEALCRGCHRKI